MRLGYESEPCIYVFDGREIQRKVLRDQRKAHETWL